MGHTQKNEFDAAYKKIIKIVFSNVGYLLKSNLIFVLVMFPAIALFFVASENNGQWFLVFTIAGLIASVVAGPALTALYRLLGNLWIGREETVWKCFKKSFKSSFKSTWFVGILYTAILFFQYYAYVTTLYLYINIEGYKVPFIQMVLFMFSASLLAMIAPYFFLQSAYIHLPASKMITNSVLLSLAQAPRSLAGALLGAGLIMLQVALAIYALPILLLIGFSLPIFLNITCIWKPFSNTFQIEETLNKNE